MLWLIAIGGGVAFAVVRRRGGATPTTAEPSWPPLRLASSEGAVTGVSPAEPDEPIAPVAEPAAAPPPVPEADDAVVVDEAVTVDDAVDGDLVVPEESARWVAPEGDGSCPTTHPIKANANSAIYHVPGGRFYARTRAERCYAEANEAEADGYRRAKDPSQQ